MKAFNCNGQRNVSGERIRQERTQQRCTQSDLAARVQVSGVIWEQDCISRIENGLRMVQTLNRGSAGSINRLAAGRRRKMTVAVGIKPTATVILERMSY